MGHPTWDLRGVSVVLNGPSYVTKMWVLSEPFHLGGRGVSQGRRHDVLSGGDGDMVGQNYLPPKSIFSADLGHFILKIRKTGNNFDKIQKKMQNFG